MLMKWPIPKFILYKPDATLKHYLKEAQQNALTETTESAYTRYEEMRKYAKAHWMRLPIEELRPYYRNIAEKELNSASDYVAHGLMKPTRVHLDYAEKFSKLSGAKEIKQRISQLEERVRKLEKALKITK